MSKNFFGGAIINSGPALPLAADTPDGALFYKTGAASGLYFFGFNPDSNSGSFGDQSAQAWSILVDTSGATNFVSKAGDTMIGDLAVTTTGGGTVLVGGGANSSIRFNDFNTRIGIPSANTMAFYTSGLPRMQIDNNGEVTVSGNKVWHAGNDGAGTGLDADTLDGLQGSFYLDISNFSAGTLPIARGGTGTNSGPAPGSVIYGASNTAYASTVVGPSSWLLASTGAAAPTWVNPATLTVNFAASAGTASSASSATTAGTAGTATSLAAFRSFSVTGAASTSVGVPFNGTGDVILNITSLAAGSLSGTVPVASLPSIPNSSLANSSITFGTTQVALGSTVASFSNLSSVSANTLTAVTGMSTGTLSSTAGITTTTLSASQGVSGLTLSSSSSLSVGTTATVTGLLNANGGVTIRNSGPVVTLQSTVTRSAFMHASGDNFYVLRGDVDGTTWDTGPNGRHPMTLNLVNGDAVFSGNVTAYSDRRLKEDISLIDNAVQKVQALNGVTFTRKGTRDRGVGLIAQDVRQVLPEAVAVDEDGYLSVAYGNLVGVLVEAIKAQQQQIDVLTRRLDSLID